MRIRISRSVRNAAISTVALLVLLFGGGVVYTWYVGQQEVKDTTAIAAPVELVLPSVAKPSPQAANAKASASVQSLTSPVAPGSNASVTIKTNPFAECTVVVEYNKIASKDSGLGPKVADDFGTVSWTWTVEASVPVGKWPVTVTCAHNELTAVVQEDLEVKNPE